MVGPQIAFSASASASAAFANSKLSIPASRSLELFSQIAVSATRTARAHRAAWDAAARARSIVERASLPPRFQVYRTAGAFAKAAANQVRTIRLRLSESGLACLTKRS